jgi:hypothetical protein
MRTLALVLAILPLAACQSFGWQGHGTNLTPEQKALGMKDVEALSAQHEADLYWRGVRRRQDGRSNALGRDLAKISTFMDRHFWNYDENDPYINYPTNTTALEHFGRFGLSTVTPLPVIDEVTRR